MRAIVPHVRLIHSVASTRRCASSSATARCAPGLRILIEVNVAGEHGKAGIAPEELDSFIARAPVPVAGLMRMPPLAPTRAQPPLVRRAARARRRARAEQLSMGTSQDYVVAVEEGATIVRIGTSLYS